MRSGKNIQLSLYRNDLLNSKKKKGSRWLSMIVPEWEIKQVVQRTRINRLWGGDWLGLAVNTRRVLDSYKSHEVGGREPTFAQVRILCSSKKVMCFPNMHQKCDLMKKVSYRFGIVRNRRFSMFRPEKELWILTIDCWYFIWISEIRNRIRLRGFPSM